MKIYKQLRVCVKRILKNSGKNKLKNQQKGNYD